jgi:hypothetical protein
LGDLKGAAGLERRLTAIAPATSDVDLRIMRRWQILTVANAKRLVRRKTGNLGRSIHPGSASETSATVEVSANYAAAVEMGSRPHVILPKYARVLAWGGARRLTGSLRTGAKPEFFARRVNHPGNRPYPFLRPGAMQALEDAELLDQVVLSWNRAD